MTKSSAFFHGEFIGIADRLEAAIAQEKKPHHLALAKQRLEILAARCTILAVNAGYFDYTALQENLRIAWPGKLVGGKGEITVDAAGTNHVRLVMDVSPDDGSPFPLHECTDERLARLWVFPIVQVLQTIRRDRFQGLAGSFNFRVVKTDDVGCPLGKDGRRLKMVKSETVDPQTGRKRESWTLNGEYCYVGDDWDEQDAMAYERHRVEDSAAACRTLADLLADLLEPPNTRSAPRKPGAWLGEAMTTLSANPGWSDARIAQVVGVAPSTLSRNKTYQEARSRLATGSQPPPPRGEKDGETGTVEAYE